jgi:hypothetical protein
MKNPSLYDQLAKGLGDAVADIREKAVEEPWYGRVVNERQPDAPQWPQAREAEPAPSVEREQEREAPEQDIDR